MNPWPIFAQNWWLDAVAPGQWDAAVVEENGQVIARLPYVIHHRHGLTMLTMPPLTPRLGPWLAPLPGKEATRLSREYQLLNILIDQLPQYDFFLQHFHPEITNWLPFFWRGFQQTTRYTYVLPDLTHLGHVWEGFKPNIRQAIRKATKQVHLRTDLDLEVFWRLNQLTFQRQGREPPYTLEYLARIDAACATHNQRQIFFAEDTSGRVHAALYLVWDDTSAYYLMGGNDPSLQNSGAPSLLMWEAIQFAANVTQVFDFEGSMLPGVERFFRNFGARQTPYFKVEKTCSLPLRIWHDLRGWWGMARG